VFFVLVATKLLTVLVNQWVASLCVHMLRFSVQRMQKEGITNFGQLEELLSFLTNAETNLWFAMVSEPPMTAYILCHSIPTYLHKAICLLFF
jgi:hypothetical protein